MTSQNTSTPERILDGWMIRDTHDPNLIMFNGTVYNGSFISTFHDIDIYLSFLEGRGANMSDVLIEPVKVEQINIFERFENAARNLKNYRVKYRVITKRGNAVNAIDALDNAGLNLL